MTVTIKDEQLTIHYNLVKQTRELEYLQSNLLLKVKQVNDKFKLLVDAGHYYSMEEEDALGDLFENLHQSQNDLDNLSISVEKALALFSKY